MKKVKFWCYTKVDGETKVEMKRGQTDGEFCYYRDDNKVWRVIHPAVGLVVTTGQTLKDAISNVALRVPDVERIKMMKPTWEDLVNGFKHDMERAIAERDASNEEG